MSSAELAVVLNDLRKHFGRYLTTADDHDCATLALWVAHTYLCEETYTSPRLLFDSPVPGSGKTTALEHIAHLARDPVIMSTVSSPALIPRMIHERIRTLCIDECDRSLSPKKLGVEDVLAVLNSGYKRGAARPVLVPDKNDGWRTVEMSTFAPVAMAGNSPNLPEDTMSRIIEIMLIPAADDDYEETDWELMDGEVEELRAHVESAADDVREAVRTQRPELSKDLTGRRKECWRPLKRVAVAAGDEWAALTDVLIGRDVERLRLAKEDGATVDHPHVVLLKDIFEAFEDADNAPFMTTDTMLSRLIGKNADMWDGSVVRQRSKLTAQRLGKMLSTNYRIYSTRPTTPKNAPRGYNRVDFAKTWRYMGLAKKQNPRKEPENPETPEQPENTTTSRPPVSPVSPVTPDAKQGVRKTDPPTPPVVNTPGRTAGQWLGSGEPVLPTCVIEGCGQQMFPGADEQVCDRRDQQHDDARKAAARNPGHTR